MPKTFLGVFTPHQHRGLEILPNTSRAALFPFLTNVKNTSHMSHSQMKPEVTPLPPFANEEPSELYEVWSPGCCSSAGASGGQTVRLDRWNWSLWSFLPLKHAAAV